MNVQAVHTDFAWFVVISNAVCGLWALAAHWSAPFRRRELWWLVIVAEVGVFVQVGLGVYALSVQGIEAPDFHVFYGFVTLVTIAILAAYRSQLRAHLYLLYGWGSLFLMGLGIRAMLKG